MNTSTDSWTAAPRFLDLCRDVLAIYPRTSGVVGIARSPGSADVMGGIVEDSGSLVLTTTLALAVSAACWPTNSGRVSILLKSDAANGGSSHPLREFHLPAKVFQDEQRGLVDVLNDCRSGGADWAAAVCLTLHQAVGEGILPMPKQGLVILLESEFPEDIDLGKQWVQSAAALEALCRLFQVPLDRLNKCRLCSLAVAPITGLYNFRTPMTALCGPPNGALLQLRFYPQPVCQTLELPPGITITTTHTRLARPTTQQRLIETRICAELGRALIAHLQQIDGQRVDPATNRLASITPTEYVERYRNRLPSKITGQAFMTKFSGIRGLDGQLNPQATYKIRSRAEHHIYENRRVHEFATCIGRARRTGSPEALVQAGELMYASHWSHSQRCGIGGVEADQLVAAIRNHGATAGLFGAKVTAGGQGGELVVLMRDDARAHEALAGAITESQSGCPINVYRGPMPGAEFCPVPELSGLLEGAAVG